MKKVWYFTKESVGFCTFLFLCAFILVAVYLPEKLLEDKR